jgi:hypothetical protein
MAVGPVTFLLEPAEAGNPQALPADVQQEAAAGNEGVAPLMQGTSREGPLPPPGVPLSQTSTTTREDMKEELSSYLDTYAGLGTLDYSTIQATILTSGDWYGLFNNPSGLPSVLHPLAWQT